MGNIGSSAKAWIMLGVVLPSSPHDIHLQLARRTFARAVPLALPLEVPGFALALVLALVLVLLLALALALALARGADVANPRKLGIVFAMTASTVAPPSLAASTP